MLPPTYRFAISMADPERGPALAVLRPNAGGGEAIVAAERFALEDVGRVALRLAAGAWWTWANAVPAERPGEAR
jgi:hypothetical protein